MVYLEYGTGGESKTHVLSENELREHTTFDQNTKVQTVQGKKKVKIKPIREDAQSVCRVVLKFTLDFPAEYTDVTNFGGETVGLTVRLDRIPSDFEFVSGGDDSLHHEPGSTSWYFDRPFVSGQNVRVWWFRKSQPQLIQ